MSVPSRAINRDNASTLELWQIAETGDVSKLAAVLQRGANINACNSNGVTALMKAAAAGHTEMVRELLEHGAALEARREDGFTPLLLATFFGHLDTVHTLVDYGADLHTTTRCGNSAEEWARARAFDDIALYLHDARSNRRIPAPKFFKPNVEKPAPKPVLVEGVFKEQPKRLIADLPVDIKQELDSVEDNAEELSGHLPLVEQEFDSAEYYEEEKLPAVRTLKDPPEIWDLVHSAPAKFNPGTAFVGRLTSSWTNRILFCLFMSLIAGALVLAFLKFRVGTAASLFGAFKTQPAAVREKPTVTNNSQQTGVTESPVNPPTAISNSDQPIPAPVTDNTNTTAATTSSAHVSAPSRAATRRTKQASASQASDAPDEVANKTQSISTPKAVGESSASENVKKAPATGLSPQLIGPAKSAAPTPKPKVIQWP